MAEKFPAVVAFETCHGPASSNKRILWLGASVAAADPSIAFVNAKSMLDWPLHNQTSPTCRPVSVIVSAPEVMTMLPGAVLAAMLARFTRHLPAESAVVDKFCPLNETETFALAAAVPNTGTA